MTTVYYDSVYGVMNPDAGWYFVDDMPGRLGFGFFCSRPNGAAGGPYSIADMWRAVHGLAGDPS